MENIILASASPRRKKLLEQLGLYFQVHPSSKSENYNPKLPPRDIVQHLAQHKAQDVAQQFQSGLIIGADTIVAHNQQILEKPRDRTEARSMLKQLACDTHSVFTGVAFCQRNNRLDDLKICTFFEETKVAFGPLQPQDIAAYVKNGSPMDKAGAYGIQDDYGSLFVKSIEGDYNTVVGLPVHRLYQELLKFAPQYLKKSL